jgi:hypothetical protein
VADYLEVDDHGHEYRVCAAHTDSKTHASRLPTWRMVKLEKFHAQDFTVTKYAAQAGQIG